MVVVPPDFPEGDEKKTTEFVKKLLADQTVSKLEAKVWEKRQLAYEIKKYTEAVYLLATFEADAVDSKKLDQQVKLQPLVLRFLLTKVDDKA